MKNAYKIYRVKVEKDVNGADYVDIVPHDAVATKSFGGPNSGVAHKVAPGESLLDKDFVNEIEALQWIEDAKARGEVLEGEFVILNVKTF